MKTIVKTSCATDAETIFKELSEGINEALLVLYFSPEENFKSLTQKISESFSGTKSMGCTTHGTITKDGFPEKSAQAIWFIEGIECSGDFIPEIASFPLKSVQKIKNCVDSLSSTENTICLEFTTAFSCCEELVITALDTVTSEYDIPVVGGTCGLSGQEDESTFTAINGKIYEGTSVFMLIRNINGKIGIFKENIYVPTKHTFTASSVDLKNRIIKELNRKPALSVLEEALEKNGTELSEYMKEHPLGRITENEIYISAFEKINYDRSISFSSRIYNNTKVSILEPGDFSKITKLTIEKIKKEIENPSLIFMINCDARRKVFEKHKYMEEFIEEWKNAFPSLSGFSSHGEQFGKIHFNLTLLAVVFE